MSSCVAVEPSATPSTGHPVRRFDALFGVFRYARVLSSPPTTTDADTNAAVMTDRRIVRVTGPLVHSDILSKVLWFVGESIEGVHVKTIPIVSVWCMGMAVNTSETLMAVSGGRGEKDHKLYLYALPGGELLRTIGEKGDGPGQFRYPQRVCFGPNDVIIVADYGNNRMQEFTSSGECKRSIAVNHPIAVTISCDMRTLCVGGAKVLSMLDYDSGVVLHTIVDTLTNRVTGVRFTPDDTHIVACAYGETNVKMFSVADGSFVRSMFEGLGRVGKKDVCFAGIGDIIVADGWKSRICVFTPDGSTLKRQFGSEGTGDGQFKKPTALSLVNGRLYVCDCDSPRVHVFE